MTITSPTFRPATFFGGLTPQEIERADCVIATDHDGVDLMMVVKSASKVVDLRNAVRRSSGAGRRLMWTCSKGTGKERAGSRSSWRFNRRVDVELARIAPLLRCFSSSHNLMPDVVEESVGYDLPCGRRDSSVQV